MKTADYIKSLVKENEKLKEACKTHVETIFVIKRDMNKIRNIITKKDKTITKLENESINIKTQKELEKVKNKLKDLKLEYKDLKNKYNDIVKENTELKRIFDDIENMCNSDNK